MTKYLFHRSKRGYYSILKESNIAGINMTIPSARISKKQFADVKRYLKKTLSKELEFKVDNTKHKLLLEDYGGILAEGHTVYMVKFLRPEDKAYFLMLCQNGIEI